LSHNSFKPGRKVLLFVLMLVMVFQSGCSSTNHYKILSFFFDGVPDPSAGDLQKGDSIKAVDTTSFAQNAVNRPVDMTHLHPPYKDKQCSTCHDQGSMGKLRVAQPGLCYQCHDDFANRFKVLHGPVGGGQCTMCHSPHMSVNEAFAIRTGQDLCLHCHETDQVMANESHRDIGDTGCTKCHNPHGGNDSNLLR
jgi:predicted CXXCH cytochrome family protein